jgi:pyroglutamyl-peptidase
VSGVTEQALLAGFEPYGGRSVNPSARLASSLDGERVGDLVVAGRVLPVALAGLGRRVEELLDETRPALVIALGLWPGEAMIRLERYAMNLADFAIPDNRDARHEDMPVSRDGAVALAASLPLRAIEHDLLAAGIPAQLSTTAGTYLCNATLYHFLAALARRGTAIPCGFIHLPYLPEQVAEMMREARAGRLDMRHRADIASMDYAVMERAVRIALTTSAALRTA